MNDETTPPREETPTTSGSEFVGAPEISRRVGAILDAVESEAQRLREEARDEANRYLEHAKRRADGLVAERQRRISAVSDELLAKAEAVVGRLEDAAPVRAGFENLVRALGDAAERLARETQASEHDFDPQPFHEVTSRPPAAPPRSPDPAPPAPPQPSQPARPLGYSAESPPRFAGAEDHGDEPRVPVRQHPARSPSAPEWRDPAAVPSPPGEGSPPANWRQVDEARVVAIQMATTGATRAGVREHLDHALGVTDTAAILDDIFGSGTGEDAQVPWTAGPR